MKLKFELMIFVSLLDFIYYFNKDINVLIIIQVMSNCFDFVNFFYSKNWISHLATIISWNVTNLINLSVLNQFLRKILSYSNKIFLKMIIQ